MHASASLARTLCFDGKTVVHHIPHMVLPGKTYVLWGFGVLFRPASAFLARSLFLLARTLFYKGKLQLAS